MEEKTQAKEGQPEKPTKSFYPRYKWPIILGAIIIFLVFIIGSFYLGQSLGKNETTKIVNNFVPTPSTNTSQTANWQTYVNTKYGYSIKYPKNWSAREFPDKKDGAAFTSSIKPNDYEAETITIDALNKPLNHVNDPFTDYVKIAGTQEIQNYNYLNSINTITTESGLTGYVTSWTSKPPTGQAGTLPRTYFELPNDKTVTVQVALGDEKDLEIYNQMLSTFSLTK